MSRGDQRYPLADHRRDDVDHEVVYLVCVEEQRDDSRPAHHPDVLAFLSAHATRKVACRLANPFDSPCSIAGRAVRLREYVVFGVFSKSRRCAAGKPLDLVIGLPAPDHGIDRPQELRVARVSRGPRPLVEPVDPAIRPGGVAVGARGDVDDDPPLHGVAFSAARKRRSSRHACPSFASALGHHAVGKKESRRPFGHPFGHSTGG